MIEITLGQREKAFAVTAVYGRDSLYTPPLWTDFDRMLDPARNPLTRQDHGRFELFTALRDGAPVGRIVACIHDASNKKFGLTRGQFGYFDCIDDQDIANQLLARAEQCVRERGATSIAGNFNLTAMQQIGIVTDGFANAPYTDMMWSPPTWRNYCKPPDIVPLSQ